MTFKETQEILTVLQQGGVALVPFDVGYALLGGSQGAVDKIFALKQRAREKPCVTLGTPDIFRELTGSKRSGRVSHFTYPVGLVERVNHYSLFYASIPSGVLVDEHIAVFLNMGTLADSLARTAFMSCSFIYGSSANISGSGNRYTLAAVEEPIRKGVDYTVEGSVQYQSMMHGKGLGATILDLENRTVVRSGLCYNEVTEQARELGLLV